MSDIRERLAAMRAREQAATRGPWKSRHGTFATPDRGPGIIVDDKADAPVWRQIRAATVPKNLAASDANFRFIAHAREDIPLLLAVAEAAAEYQRCWESYKAWCRSAEPTFAENRVDARNALFAALDALAQEAGG